MIVGKSVQKAIDEIENGDFESAMLHACNAVDGTAAKLFPEMGSKARFGKLLRDSYGILGPMGMPGLNLVQTRFPVNVRNPKASGGKPDLVDVIYGIHRCAHGHGAALPGGFELADDLSGPAGVTTITIQDGSIQLSNRIIFGLLAVAVLSPANADQTVPDGYHFTFGTAATMMINEWWGHAADFPTIVAQEPLPSVTLDFDDWMK